MTVLYVAFGGAFGAVARYLISYRLMPFLGMTSSYGTFLVNSLGSFLMGFAMVFLAAKAGPDLKALIIIGFLGSFTTFSTYSADLIRLIETEDWVAAGAYGAFSIILGLVGFISGSAIAALMLAKSV